MSVTGDEEQVAAVVEVVAKAATEAGAAVSNERGRRRKPATKFKAREAHERTSEWIRRNWVLVRSSTSLECRRWRKT